MANFARQSFFGALTMIYLLDAPVGIFVRQLDNNCSHEPVVLASASITSGQNTCWCRVAEIIMTPRGPGHRSLENESDYAASLSNLAVGLSIGARQWKSGHGHLAMELSCRTWRLSLAEGPGHGAWL